MQSNEQVTEVYLPERGLDIGSMRRVIAPVQRFDHVILNLRDTTYVSIFYVRLLSMNLGQRKPRSVTVVGGQHRQREELEDALHMYRLNPIMR